MRVSNWEGSKRVMEGEYEHSTLYGSMKFSSVDKIYFAIYKKAAPPKNKITAYKQNPLPKAMDVEQRGL